MTLSHPESNELTRTIIGDAIAVHSELGPGLLEKSYDDCLYFAMAERPLQIERQRKISIVFRSHVIPDSYKADLIVNNSVIIEVKSVEKIIGVHKAQVLSYMKHSGIPVGLLINFNVERLVDDITRLSL